MPFASFFLLVNEVEEDKKYHALIVDSGAIIKHSEFSTLHNSASKYCTTQGVIDEIRDSKARHHLDSLPFQLDVREPSPDGGWLSGGGSGPGVL